WTAPARPRHWRRSRRSANPRSAGRPKPPHTCVQGRQAPPAAGRGRSRAPATPRRLPGRATSVAWPFLMRRSALAERGERRRPLRPPGGGCELGFDRADTLQEVIGRPVLDRPAIIGYAQRPRGIGAPECGEFRLAVGPHRHPHHSARLEPSAAAPAEPAVLNPPARQERRSLPLLPDQRGGRVALRVACRRRARDPELVPELLPALRRPAVNADEPGGGTGVDTAVERLVPLAHFLPFEAGEA